jgi:hypothetical protein
MSCGVPKPPPEDEDRDADRLPDKVPERLPEKVRCSLTGSRGAGAITELLPIFKSPRTRVDGLSTLGGGAMTASCGACKAAEFGADKSGGGATTDVCSPGEFEFRRCAR